MRSRIERSIALVGIMGAGKSTVGRLLALGLGVAFVDLDAAIEAVAGRSVAELFAREGEPTVGRGGLRRDPGGALFLRPAPRLASRGLAGLVGRALSPRARRAAGAWRGDGVRGGAVGRGGGATPLARDSGRRVRRRTGRG